ncbi:MAG: vWA domain-containing protein [Acidimicrobiia bacterium]
MNPRPHIYLLLDRSGSMASMVCDVIGGFNTFLDEQRALSDDARMTLVQFDSQDPQEVLVSAAPLARVRHLSPRTFQPRGGTPLLDATGRLIARAAVRQEERRVLGKRAEEIIFVTITDGHENQSVEYSKTAIMRLVAEKQVAGWTFVYLGAGLDAYGEAGGLGYDMRSSLAWAPDGTGARAAFADLSRATTARRQKMAAGAPIDKADYFEGRKDAEADRDRRHGR